MAIIIAGCMYAGLILRLAALIFMAKERLYSKYVCWSVYLLLGSIRTAILLYFWHHSEYRSYNAFHISTQDAMLMLRTAAAIEALWIVGRHWRNFATFFVGAVGFAGVVSAWFASETVAWMVAPGQWQMQAVRTHSIVILLTFGMAAGFYRGLRALPLRQNPKRHWLCLYAMFSLITLGSGIIAAKVSLTATGIGMIVLVLGDVVAGLSWTLWMRQGGESYTAPPPPRRTLRQMGYQL